MKSAKQFIETDSKGVAQKSGAKKASKRVQDLQVDLVKTAKEFIAQGEQQDDSSQHNYQQTTKQSPAFQTNDLLKSKIQTTPSSINIETIDVVIEATSARKEASPFHCKCNAK